MTDESEFLKQYIAMQRIGKEARNDDERLPVIRIAVLSDHATQQFVAVLRAAIREFGYFPEVYEADYGTAALEAFDRDSQLHVFKPEAIVYSVCVQKYRSRFLEAQTPAERDDLPSKYLAEILGVVDALTETGALVVVSNMALPIERQFGNFGLHTRQSIYGGVLEFNRLLSEAARSRPACIINDVMYIANRVGASQFFDERLWLNAKYPCALRYFPELTRSIARALMARKGRISKVLVLDLDNTLWGGVIGDDGLEGIRLGGDAEGEAYAAFQSYLKSLKGRGYVLAVCSKNNESVAIEAFRSHPEMVLKEDDIAVFVANWNDKATNIEYISRVLNLGIDSFIFIDDMPFERDLVRTRHPKAYVPEMPEDPAEYVRAIEFSGVLEGTGFSDEDFRRNQTYREEALRSTEQIKYGSIDEYLAGLQMKAEASFFRKEDVPRVAQLIQRSNQFNLRTQRIDEGRCLEYMSDSDGKFGLQIRLADRFGDYGLISVVCCDTVGRDLFITELVMSCRVLKRGVESLIMNRLFRECRARGLDGVRGEYVASAKNSMVKEFFAQFGFAKEFDSGDRSKWYLRVAEYNERSVFISEDDV